MTTLPPAGAPDVLYVVDLPAWVHRALHATKGDVSRAHPGLPVVVGWLVKLLTDRQPAFLIAADECGGPTWRERIFPAYKAERRAKPRPDGLAPLMTQTRRLFAVHGVPVVSVPENEADDVIATVATRAVAAGLRVVIVGRDKDLGQLVSDQVLLWDGESKDALGPAEITKRWGVGPERVVDVMALMGDAGDGVPGVPGIGEKSAGPLVARRGSFEEVIRLAQWEPKHTRKLQLGADAGRLSKQLVTLRRDLDLGVRFQDCATGWADTRPIRAFHLEHGFTKLAEQVEPNLKRALPASRLKAAAAAGWAT